MQRVGHIRTLQDHVINNPPIRAHSISPEYFE